MTDVVLKLYGPCDLCLLKLLSSPPMSSETLAINIRTVGGNELHLCQRHWDKMMEVKKLKPDLFDGEPRCRTVDPD